MFSEPAPLASTWIRTWSPGTTRVWMNAGVLSPVFRAVEQRVADDRTAQVPVAVPLPNALVDRVIQIGTGDVHVLAEVEEDHRVARVLAVGVLPLRGQLLVADQEVEHLPSERRLLQLSGAPDQPHHLLGDLVVDLDAEIPDDPSDLRRIDLAWFGHGTAMLTAVLPGVRCG
jgi:hypothetical protein